MHPDADEIHGDGIDENCNGSEDETLEAGCGTDYSTIQDAVDNSNSGDTITICSGTYNESVNARGKDLTFKAKAGADVVVTGDGSERAFTLSNGDFAIEGITISGSYSPTHGGAILVKDGASLDLTDNIISNNESTDYGATLAVEDGGSVVVYSGMFTDNYSGSEVGGMYVEGSVVLSPDDGDIVMQNSPLNYLDNGGYFAINTGTYDVTLSDSTVGFWNFYVGEDSTFWAYGTVSEDENPIVIYLKEPGAQGFFSLAASGYITIDPSGESFTDTTSTRALCYYDTGTCDIYSE